MRARVTNTAGSARGFHAADGATLMLEPGASALLDLAEHPAHDAWVAAGDVKIVPEADSAEPPPSVREQARSALLPRAGEGARASRGRMRAPSG